MAVAFDVVGPSATGVGSAVSTSLVWNHTCGTGATHLLVGVTLDKNPDTGLSMSATYNTVTMTPLGVWHAGGGSSGFLQVWAMASPPTGSALQVAITAAGGTPDAMDGASMSFTGSTGLSAVQSATGTGTNPSANFTGAVAGNIVAGFLGAGSAATQTGSFTSRYEVNDGFLHGCGESRGQTIASSGTVTDSFTMASDSWAIALVEVQAGGVAGSVAGAAAPVTAAAPAGAAFGASPNANVAGQSAHVTAAAPAGVPAGAAPNANVAGQSAPVTVASPAGVAGFAAITGVAGGALGYFVNQSGTPILYAQDIGWGLPGNAGRWSSGDWQGDMRQYLDTRHAQGFNCTRIHALSTTKTGCLADNGDTWDGVHPFTTGTDPSSGLNSTYWARVDYLIDYAATLGTTIELNIAFTYDWDAGVVCNTWTTLQCTDWGTAIGNRYKGRANVLWMFGDDNYEAQNTQFEAIHSGLRASGDTHAATIEYNSEGSTSLHGLDVSPSSTVKTWGGAHAQYNLVYYYNAVYFGIEFAYQETGPLPVIWGDGPYIGTIGDDATGARAERNFVWWALASGARGYSTGSDAVKFWLSGAAAALTAEEWFITAGGHIPGFFQSLPGWHLLQPDLSSQLVTAGRGTRLGYTSAYWAYNSHSDYVCASLTPDGSLAVIYCESAFSITIDESKLGAGYTATWVDPASCATSTATPGSTYASGPLGNNSDGFADWVLVLQGPPLFTNTSPAYAVTATDLGSGSGSWVNPSHAQGTPDTSYATWTAP